MRDLENSKGNRTRRAISSSLQRWSVSIVISLLRAIIISRNLVSYTSLRSIWIYRCVNKFEPRRGCCENAYTSGERACGIIYFECSRLSRTNCVFAREIESSASLSICPRKSREIANKTRSHLETLSILLMDNWNNPQQFYIRIARNERHLERD